MQKFLDDLRLIETVSQELQELLLEKKKIRKCALIVGHKESSQGAVSPSGITEFAYNQELAELIKKYVERAEVVIVYRRTYEQLPDDVNQIKPDFAVSLHCNAFNKKASGSEVLYYEKSSKGKELARKLQTAIVKVLGLPDRGIKAKTSEDRGGYLLRYVKAPIVIIEPFFIDNPADYMVGAEKKAELAEAIAHVIDLESV
uniref:Putative N-acetylmuramoyl-L-alanine amidase n=3 Tax=viral metagenome TaxID=1070528 RepID=A0A6M3LXK8_9ZZZZ